MILAIGLTVAACGGSGTATTAPPPATAAPEPFDCEVVSGLVAVTDALAAADDACDGWIDASLGRAVMGSTGSVSLWSRATPSGTALLVGAVVCCAV